MALFRQHPELLEQMLALYKEGYLSDGSRVTSVYLAQQYHCDHTTILYHIKRHIYGIHKPPQKKRGTTVIRVQRYIPSVKLPRAKSYLDYVREARAREPHNKYLDERHVKTARWFFYGNDNYEHRLNSNPS